MKVSELWLREWVTPPITTEQLAAQLTMAGLEVDSLSPVAGPFNHVVVAKVLEAAPHPEADKLSLCVVDCGKEAPLQIVCGAANVRAGLKVALAMIGATLPNGMCIKETKLRGRLSQGMLCSTAELGMVGEAQGIMELADDAPVGVDLREYMGLDDTIIDVDLTPNRADCFSVYGIAREVATLNKLPLCERQVAAHTPQHDDTVAVHLDAPAACPYYVGRVIRGINPHATTPLWLAERLRRAGVRAIHPVVDVTNYVMLAFGQPMHAFDRDTLTGAIHVRYSQPGETLILLDEQEVTLQAPTLVIADEKKALAIAGVMGGAESAVNADTTSIFLESAFFAPHHIAGVARRYGLCTESSQRFERGVDTAIQQLALDYATELLQDIVGGEVGPIVESVNQAHRPVEKSLSFNPAQVLRLTGVEIAETDMLQALTSLGLTADTTTKPWLITVPSHRFDIELDVDIVEEMIRIYGYDKINVQPMIDTMQPGDIHPIERVTQRINTFLVARGYHEMISYSFVEPAIQEALYPDSTPMALLNPISSDLSQMRLGIWPGLIAAMVYNNHRQQSQMKLFEAGVVFNTDKGVLEERSCIAGLLTGEKGSLSWSEPSRHFDFYDLKGDLEALFSDLALTALQFEQAAHPALHPGKAARIKLGENAIGWIGVLHPEITESLSIDDDVVVFEIELAPLVLAPTPQYKRLSKFPSVRRDLSFLIDETVLAGQIEAAVRDVLDGEILKSFDVFDVYKGETIPAGKKSVAIALTLQDGSRTLVDEDINGFVDVIVEKLHQEFAILLRD